MINEQNSVQSSTLFNKLSSGRICFLFFISQIPRISNALSQNLWIGNSKSPTVLNVHRKSMNINLGAFE